MKKKTSFGLLAIATALIAVSYFAYQRWVPTPRTSRDELLSPLPPDASAILFVDLTELRQAPFFAALYAWAPKPQADPDYAQFLKDTGFDFEHDLNRLAIAIAKHGLDTSHFAVADGKFDRQKISGYALKAGTVAKISGHEIFSVPLSGNPGKISFTFVSNNRIALTDDSNPTSLVSPKKSDEDAAQWRARFERLAGSPLFAVIRQDAAAGAALAAQAPGGFRSPQLSALLDQLQWITFAGKPENDRLRIIAEGESPTDATARQLSDLLNGVVILAQAGLNDPNMRQQLAPAAREAYLEVLKSADISKIDRGDTKSVRLVFDITPGFLEAARTASPVVPGSIPAKPPLRGNASASRKGHT